MFLVEMLFWQSRSNVPRLRLQSEGHWLERAGHLPPIISYRQHLLCFIMSLSFYTQLSSVRLHNNENQKVFNSIRDGPWSAASVFRTFFHGGTYVSCK